MLAAKMPSPLYCCGLPIAVVAILVLGFWIHWQYVKRFNRHLFQYLRARLGRGHSIGELASRLKMQEQELLAVVVNYREQAIPKRRGGVRVLQVPDSSLMRVQRKILHLLLRRLRVHDAAHGFERGRSIVTNANPHAGRAILVKMDIEAFFGHTTAARVEVYFRRVGWNAQAAALLTKLVTYNGSLPQGAPTSPRLSNLLNMQLDARLACLAQRKRGVYTRYADDITFSFLRDVPDRARGVVQVTRRHLKHFGYTLNQQKTRILRPHQHKRVTGLEIHGTPRLPLATRRWLRAVRYNASQGRDITLTPAQLAGWEALEKMVEQQATPPNLPKLRKRSSPQNPPSA